MLPFVSTSPTSMHQPRAGFTLVELLAATAVLTIAAGAVISTLVTGSRLHATSQEEAAARAAIEATIEHIKATPFRDVFAAFNAAANDDPAGPDTARGASFEVRGLTPVAGAPAGQVGEVVFPTVGGALREDVDLPAISMPRDLDLDGVVDAADHASDYAVLPILIRARWRGAGGERTVEYAFNLGDLR